MINSQFGQFYAKNAIKLKITQDFKNNLCQSLGLRSMNQCKIIQMGFIDIQFN